MSRLSRYLREHRTRWAAFLVVCVQSLNALLLIVGVCMVAYAGDLYAGGRSRVTWLAFGLMGLVACASASAALGATCWPSLALLNTHLCFLALLMAGQVCLSAAVVAGSGATVSAADQSSTVPVGGAPTWLIASLGGRSPAVAELREALMSCVWADWVAVSVEATTLLFSCLLQSAFTRADEAAEDAEEGLLLQGDQFAPLLTSRRREEQRQGPQGDPGGRRSTPVPPRTQRDDPWSRRMRDQYGLDTSVLGYDPQHHQQQQQQAEVAGRSAGHTGRTV